METQFISAQIEDRQEFNNGAALVSLKENE